MAKIILDSKGLVDELEAEGAEQYSRGILEYVLPDDQQAFVRAAMGDKAHDALYDISQKVFRPHRRHGYGGEFLTNDEVNQLNIWLEKSDEVLSAIGILERMFYKIINEYQIDLD